MKFSGFKEKVNYPSKRSPSYEHTIFLNVDELSLLKTAEQKTLNHIYHRLNSATFIEKQKYGVYEYSRAIDSSYNKQYLLKVSLLELKSFDESEITEVDDW